jgi:hypothetical protein
VIRRGKPEDVNMEIMDGNVKMEKMKGTISVMLGVLDSGPYSSHAECSW